MCNIPCQLCGDYEGCEIRNRTLAEDEFDISDYEEYLQIGSHNPDIEKLGLADCLPEDY